MTAALRRLGTKVKRAPVRLRDDMAAADLGDCRELEVGDRVFSWKVGEAALLWLPGAKTLLVVPAKMRTRVVSDERLVKKAGRVFRLWADREPVAGRQYDVPTTGGSWYSLGRASRIDYKSNKWDRVDEYTHKLAPRDRAWLLSSRSSYVLAVRGPTLRVTARGIVG